jgi:hypothetical protein
MLFREQIDVYSYCKDRKKHVHLLCEQNIKFLMLKLVLHVVTIVLWRVKSSMTTEYWILFHNEQQELITLLLY